MDAPTVEDLLDQLRARGERITTARRAVITELLADDAEHLSADQLVERVNAKHPDVHLSTIYRTLEFLEHAGIISEVHAGGPAASYHLAGHGHHHAMCDRCGTLVEFPDGDLRSLVQRLDRDHGFAATPRHLIITGLCRACRER
jgi:Fur family ferric uptake transcriptional regulator